MKKEYLVYAVIFAAVVVLTIILAGRLRSSNDGSLPLLSQDEFLGETIVQALSWPSSLGFIDVAISFPPNYKFLPDAKPYLKLYSDQKFIQEWFLESPNQRCDLQKKIDADKVYAELGIFYCKDDAEPLCLSRKVRFEIAVEKSSEFYDVSLNYQVPEEN